MLRAYIDDSGNIGDSKVCVLAGYVSTVEKWTTFSDQWKAVLDKPEPKTLSYFKMKEASARRGEFDLWTPEQVDARLQDLAMVINDNVMLGLSCILYTDDYLAARQKATAKTNFDDPYFFMFCNIIQRLALFQRSNGWHEQVDFVFDAQNKAGHRIVDVYDTLQLSAPTKIKNLNIMGNLPIFQNDKQFLPLQSADMIAWQLRRSCITNQETDLMRKLRTVHFEDSIWDAPVLDFVINGTNMIADLMKAVPAGMHMRAALEIKSLIESMIESKDDGHRP